MKCPKCGTGQLRVLFSVTGSKAVPLDETGHPDYDQEDLEIQQADADYIDCTSCGYLASLEVDYNEHGEEVYMPLPVQPSLLDSEL